MSSKQEDQSLPPRFRVTERFCLHEKWILEVAPEVELGIVDRTALCKVARVCLRGVVTDLGFGITSWAYGYG